MNEVNANPQTAQPKQEQVAPEIEPQVAPEVLANDMSDEDFEKNFDDIAENELSGGQPEITQSEQPVQEQVAPNLKEQIPTADAVQAEPEFIPPFDPQLFNQLPEDYQELFKPIKANGQMITPDPQKQIQLIQLGSKYYKDRETIKPKLMNVKALEKNQIDSDRLNFLIDINNGDKDAIAKLLKEKEIDIYDIDEEKASTYEPNNHKVSEEEYKLDEIISEIENTDTFEPLLANISKYDDNSKNFINENPEVLNVLNTHLGNGIYDEVVKTIEEKKTFGELLDVSFIDAYKSILDDMVQTQQVNNQQASTGQPQQVDPNIQASYQQQVQQAVAQKPTHIPNANTPSKALSPTNSRVQQFEPPVNPNELSDEEYLRMMNL